jgi:hypothetical protein
MVKDDEFEKLSPQERIKKLKELEEKSKKEIEKAQKLIRESEEEIAIEEKVKQVRIPEDQEVDVKKLFRREEPSLEETVEKEAPKISEEDLRQQQQYLKKLTTDRIEERANYLQRQINETGYINNQQMAEVAAMYQEIQRREEGLEQGTYKPVSARVEEELDMARGIAKKILGEFYNR